MHTIGVEERRARTCRAGHRMQAPVAHPRRVVRGAVSGKARACDVPRPVVGGGPSGAVVADARWLRLKVVGITVLALVGGVVGVSGYVSAVLDEGPADPVAEAAAWSHVEP